MLRLVQIGILAVLAFALTLANVAHAIECGNLERQRCCMQAIKASCSNALGTTDGFVDFGEQVSGATYVVKIGDKEVLVTIPTAGTITDVDSIGRAALDPQAPCSGPCLVARDAFRKQLNLADPKVKDAYVFLSSFSVDHDLQLYAGYGNEKTKAEALGKMSYTKADKAGRRPERPNLEYSMVVAKPSAGCSYCIGKQGMVCKAKPDGKCPTTQECGDDPTVVTALTEGQFSPAIDESTVDHLYWAYPKGQPPSIAKHPDCQPLCVSHHSVPSGSPHAPSIIEDEPLACVPRADGTCPSAAACRDDSSVSLRYPTDTKERTVPQSNPAGTGRGGRAD